MSPLQAVRHEQPPPARLIALLDELEEPNGALTLVTPPSDIGQIMPLGGSLSDDPAFPETLTALADRQGRFPFGLVLFWSPTLAYAVRPPLPPGERSRLSGWDTRPLLDLLGRPYEIGVILLRRGGFSIGLFHGDVLAGSKTGTRFVKNRHRKGGQSQRRFDRIREKQIDELFDKTCETAWDKLGPALPRLDAVFLGGDRRTVQAFTGQCGRLRAFGDRLQPRFLPTPEPRQQTLTLAYGMIWRSDWTELRLMPDMASNDEGQQQ